MDEKPDCLNDLDKVRHIEGFPLGTDEDICALSDPPYYTAYPNPHLADFIAQHGTPYDELADNYHREPFVGNISKTRNEPVYYANSYHTKVPYTAIAEFIRHYTDEKAVVFDGFSGSGMTGIAAQVTDRSVILCDLSPSASFLSYTYNNPISLREFDKFANATLMELERRVRHLYETKLPDGRTGVMNYAIWSDIFICPICQNEFIFWDACIDTEQKQVLDPFPCPHCNARLSKSDVVAKVDPDSNAVLGTPVVINARAGRDRTEFASTDFDLSTIEQIRTKQIPYWYPTNPVPEGYNLDQPKRSHGLHTVDQFFTYRNLWALSALYDICKESNISFSLFLFTSLLGRSTIRTMTILSNYLNKGRGGYAGKPMTGTLYIPPIRTEVSVIEQVKSRTSSIRRFLETFNGSGRDRVRISTQSITDLSNIPPNSIDYIFIDPPFGSNIMYSDLNFIEEAWLGVHTNTAKEAIVNPNQGKDDNAYRGLMLQSFSGMYKILKPKRWITVNFHNSSARIWNLIQDSIVKAGFVVAQVAVLDKQRGSFKQVTAAGSVKNDLIINAYKPQQDFTNKFLQKAGVGMEREFIKQHLGYLPIAANVERTREMLYSKMLAYYIQRGYEISLNSPQFYRLLAAEFVERDGYWFRDEAQAQEYEQRKLDPARKKTAGQGQGVLFISDERSAIAWLHHFLAAGPQTYSDLYTAYAKALQTSDDQIPELKQLLEETCVQVNGHWKRPDALTAEELETRRRDRLLRQFNDYLREATAGQRLTDVRKEAILTGFEEAYRAKRYEDITAVGAKLNRSLVDSSTEIFDFIDIAGAKLA